MIRLFDDNPSNATRALQIWQILIAKAHNRQIITYGILAKMLGVGGAAILAAPLGHIMYYCQQNDLPPLTILVVNKRTGLPGEGLIGADLNADRERVFEHNWFGIYPPTPEELRAAYEAAAG